MSTYGFVCLQTISEGRAAGVAVYELVHTYSRTHVHTVYTHDHAYTCMHIYARVDTHVHTPVDTHTYTLLLALPRSPLLVSLQRQGYRLAI